LHEACGKLLKSADQPSVGGVPAAVIVTIGVDDLLAKAGVAEASDGSVLTSDQLLRIADETEIWPAIINRDGIPLALGRSQRLASRGQTMALIARDAGCSFRGCTHPPAWCDRHHIFDWIHGGCTDLNNLTLLCRYHHTHFLQKGWACRLSADGLPEWIPPWWIDQQQRPNSTLASDASTPNVNSFASGAAHPRLHDRMLPDTAPVPAPGPKLAGAQAQSRCSPPRRNDLDGAEHWLTSCLCNAPAAT
jgi:hypothetical protein